MTMHNIQNIFELRHNLHAANDDILLRSVSNGRGFVAGMLGKLKAALANSLRNLLVEDDERKAIEHLNAMTGAQLSDLGITRPDIRRAVQYGKESL
ncbi:MAG: hypothetical protein ACI9LO_000833 [Planctomycetota bacterium]|jgi:uncharacterized protein YjiS (DUF1127 family)